MAFGSPGVTLKFEALVFCGAWVVRKRFKPAFAFFLRQALHAAATGLRLVTTPEVDAS